MVGWPPSLAFAGGALRSEAGHPVRGGNWRSRIPAYAGMTLRGFFSNTSERTVRNPHPAFHQHARAAAHDRLGDVPFAIDLTRLRADTQRAGRMAEADGL